MFSIFSERCSEGFGEGSMSGAGNSEYLRQLEEEQEHLNNSLQALTSHFAQVQFRLKQIIDAPSENKQVCSFSLIRDRTIH